MGSCTNPSTRSHCALWNLLMPTPALISASCTPLSVSAQEVLRQRCRCADFGGQAVQVEIGCISFASHLPSARSDGRLGMMMPEQKFVFALPSNSTYSFQFCIATCHFLPKQCR